MRRLAALAVLIVAPLVLPAQKDTTKVGAPAAPAMGAMRMAGVLGISMDRMGSGTAWIPDAVPLPSADAMAGGWDLMLHGFAFGQYDYQGGPRGASQWGSLSWAMLMATHDVGSGKLQFRTMLSLDAAGVTSRGYPLLLQTGESFRGEPLHDRQHPHDFWMELGALYDFPLASNLGIELYAAPSGEPALGPTAFMHRPSAMDEPAAPIGHHWQDASHVSFGVLTAGLFGRAWKLEGSVFNGRDPDENRWNFDLAPLESYSGRLTVNPGVNWSLTAGFGFIRSPEPQDPGHSMHRASAAVEHSERLGDDRRWATTLLWGAVGHSDEPGYAHSVLLESELVADARNTVFGRMEFAQKRADELALPASVPGERLFDVGNASLGYVRELWGARGATLGFGAAATVSSIPEALAPFYGSRAPVGVMVFVRVRPASRATMPDAMPGM